MFLSYLLIDVGTNPDRRRPGRLWLRNLYHVHQRLCMGFPSKERAKADPQFLEPWSPADFPEQRHLADKHVKRTKEDGGVERDVLRQVHTLRGEHSGFLFRIDPRPPGGTVILVQSALKPDWDYAFHNADYLLAAPPEMKSFTPCVANDQTLRFRLMANPTKKSGTIRKEERETYEDRKEELKERKGRHGKRIPVADDQLFDWLSRRAEASGFSVERETTAICPGYIYVGKKREGNGQRLRSVRYDGILKVTDSVRFEEAIIQGIGPGKAFGFGLLSVAGIASRR